MVGFEDTGIYSPAQSGPFAMHREKNKVARWRFPLALGDALSVNLAAKLLHQMPHPIVGSMSGMGWCMATKRYYPVLQ